MVGIVAGSMLGRTGADCGGSRSLGELSDQLLEQELAVMEATVVRHMHGHPQAHRGQLVVENL